MFEKEMCQWIMTANTQCKIPLGTTITTAVIACRSLILNLVCTCVPVAVAAVSLFFPLSVRCWIGLSSFFFPLLSLPFSYHVTLSGFLTPAIRSFGTFFLTRF